MAIAAGARGALIRRPRANDGWTRPRRCVIPNDSARPPEAFRVNRPLLRPQPFDLDTQLLKWLSSKELSRALDELKLDLSEEIQDSPSTKYGSTSAEVQYRTLKRAARQRDRLRLGHEVE
jgi:hypothetical protein